MSCGWIGHHHSAFLDSTGAVWTVGKGAEGQLGHGNENDLLAPQRVDRLPPCVAISCGDEFTACVSANGDVFCFGSNDYGQLGQGHKLNSDTPRRVDGLPPIQSLACGCNFVVCVGRDSSVWGFGKNNKGQLGLGHANEIVSIPGRMEGVTACQVACGSSHTLILDADGKLYGCGNGSQGQLGSVASSLSAVPITLPFEGIHSVYCGFRLSVIRAADDSLWTAGCNRHGQLGLGDNNDRNEFQQIPGLVCTQVSCGYKHVVAIDGQSRLWGWGSNGNRRLSPLASEKITTPTILTDAKAVLTGFFNTVILDRNGRVKVCGYNSHGQLATGATNHATPWTASVVRADTVKAFHAVSFTSHVDWQVFGTWLDLTAEEEHQLEELYKSAQRVQRLIERSSSPSFSSTRVPPAPYSLGSWRRCANMLAETVSAGAKNVSVSQSKHTALQSAITERQQVLDGLLEQVAQEQGKLQELKEQEQTIALELHCQRLEILQNLLAQCETFASPESQLQKELEILLDKQPLRSLDARQMDLVWWRAGLEDDLGKRLIEYDISGDIAMEVDVPSWQEMGLSSREACQLVFTLSMLDRPEGVFALHQLDQEDCVVCSSCSAWTTTNFLKERRIMVKDSLVKEGWIAPFLMYAWLTESEFETQSKVQYLKAKRDMRELQKVHAAHLDQLGDEKIDR